MYSVPIDGSAAPIKLSPWTWATPTQARGLRTRFDYKLTPDQSTVIYHMEIDDSHSELYSVSWDGENVTHLSTVGGGDVGGFNLLSDGNTVLYVDSGDLYKTKLDGSMSPLLLSGSAKAANTGTVSDDLSRVMFTRSASGEWRAYFVSIDGGDLAWLPGGGGLLSPDGDMLYHVFTDPDDGLRYLWATDLVGEVGEIEIPSAVPEPATMVLLAFGGLGLLRRRRRGQGVKARPTRS